MVCNTVQGICYNFYDIINIRFLKRKFLSIQHKSCTFLTITVKDKKAEEAAKKAKEEQKRLAEEKAKKEAEEKAAQEKAAQEKAAQEAAAAKAKAEAEAAAQAQAQAEAQQQAQAAAQAQAQQQQAQAQQQAGGTVYWVPNGQVYHSTPDCPSLGRSSTIYSGTIAQSGKSRPCKNCY